MRFIFPSSHSWEIFVHLLRVQAVIYDLELHQYSLRKHTLNIRSDTLNLTHEKVGNRFVLIVTRKDF